jgi:hypothetical protein
MPKFMPTMHHARTNAINSHSVAPLINTTFPACLEFRCIVALSSCFPVTIGAGQYEHARFCPLA